MIDDEDSVNSQRMEAEHQQQLEHEQMTEAARRMSQQDANRAGWAEYERFNIER